MDKINKSEAANPVDRDSQLIESERKLTTLLSNLPGMVYGCRNDEDWTMEFVSEGCRELTGFEPSELLNNARTSYAGLIHPEDRFDVWTAVNEGVKHQKKFLITYRIITKQGMEKWVFEQGQAVYSKNGKPSLEGFITDVTERKHAEEQLVKSLKEKSILLSEIHHRVKNNMQLIISLFELQKTTVSQQLIPVIDSIIERVRIFADIHQQLYQSEFVTEIDLAAHIRSIFDNLCSVYSMPQNTIKLEMSIPQPLFELDTAITLGLMINELISNSLKHAFSGVGGKISLSIIRDEDGRINTIKYTDTGCSIKSDGGGFGTILLDVLSEQLELKMSVKPDGPDKYNFYTYSS